MERLDGYNTYIGIVVSIAPMILGMFGYTPTPAFNAQFPALIAALISLAGAAYAVYGRARATVPGWIAKKDVVAPAAEPVVPQA